MSSRPRFRPRRALDAIHPAAGAAAMATGILSIALELAGFDAFSLVWLAVGVAIWVLLLAVVVVRLIRAPPRWLKEADTPASLTAVAATSVLGTRVALLGWNAVAAAAFVLSIVSWLVLIPAVIAHWRTPTVGVHFLLCVATEGLAVLGATLAVTIPARWLGALALLPFAAGLVFYVVVATRFSWAELEVGAGDHWISVGALAISSLAAGKLVYASAGAEWGMWAHGLSFATLALLALTLAGFAILVVCEVRWPRLRFDLRRWATAFPLGMTAAATLTAAHVTGGEPLRLIGLVLIWPTVAVCVVLLVAWGRHLVAAGTIAGPADMAPARNDTSAPFVCAHESRAARKET